VQELAETFRVSAQHSSRVDQLKEKGESSDSEKKKSDEGSILKGTRRERWLKKKKKALRNSAGGHQPSSLERCRRRR